MGATLRSERGSAVIIAVMAMLIMGVLSISFALLADIESRVGVSYKQQAQAEALAEAALERARDAVRTAPTVTGGFTNWLSGPTATHTLFPGTTLGPGQYWARIDNDCAAVSTVPAAIQEPPHLPGPVACNNTTDYNEVAVITAWAQAGSGRTRVRAVVGVDNPWKHVCSNAKPDNNGYCNEPGNRNGNPTVNPADPNDPNGPNAYNDLPRPILGCSRVAPGLHRGLLVLLPAQHAGCVTNPQMYSYPYPVAYNAAPRFVVMGEDPAAGGKTCGAPNDEPAGGNGNKYFGYFDCALTTFCDPNPPYNHVCGPGGARKGCLRGLAYVALWGGLPDTRVATDPAHYTEYDPASGNCVGGDTGMVYTGNQNWNANIGSQTRQVTVYAYNGTAIFGVNKQFYGTFVVEGNEINDPCSDKDFQIGGGVTSQLWTGPNSDPPAAGWVATKQYGFPVAALIYNPDLPPPTIQPTYAPQGTCADLGSNNSEVHGMVYSGGHVEFNPLSFDGTVVAFEIQTQGSATYNYNSWYGNNSPPPSFPYGSGNQVVVIRKSFVVCSNFADDSGAPSPCN